jgi:hypothetical protein
MRCTVQHPKGNKTVSTATALTEEQAQQYVRDGYLLISGLIPDEISEAAEAAMWRVIGASPEDPASWAGLSAGHSTFDEPALVACYTPAFIEAAARLAGEDPVEFNPPKRAYAINIMPQQTEWSWPKPHIDHAIKEHGHHTFPRAFKIATMTFLNDVTEHGGGTVVWSGSHRRIEAMAKSEPARYEMMWAVNQDLNKAEIGAPVELTPRRGDVLFYHYLCAHAGSMNTSSRPRLAMNCKW